MTDAATDKDLRDVLALLAQVNIIRERRPDIVIVFGQGFKLSAYVTTRIKKGDE